MAQYGTLIGASQPRDYNSNIHVLWDNSMNPETYNALFAQPTVDYISQQVTNHITPIVGKTFKVSDEEIRGIITSVWNAESGGNRADIYTQDTFNLPQDNTVADYNRIINIVVQAIVNQISVTMEMEKCNDNLDIWNQVYGDFNKAGLRAHPKIKLREKHPQLFAFNMNY